MIIRVHAHDPFCRLTANLWRFAKYARQGPPMDFGDGYWAMVADFMEEEIAAREARGRFPVVKP